MTQASIQFGNNFLQSDYRTLLSIRRKVLLVFGYTEDKLNTILLTNCGKIVNGTLDLITIQVRELQESIHIYLFQIVILRNDTADKSQKCLIRMYGILKNIDQDLLKGAVSGEKFKEYFFANCKDDAIADYIKSILD